MRLRSLALKEILRILKLSHVFVHYDMLNERLKFLLLNISCLSRLTQGAAAGRQDARQLEAESIAALASRTALRVAFSGTA
jgi:hypothetical protein